MSYCFVLKVLCSNSYGWQVFFADVKKKNSVGRVHLPDCFDEGVPYVTKVGVHGVGEQPRPQIRQFLAIFVCRTLQYRKGYA
jgi:hypothetical protein